MVSQLNHLPQGILDLSADQLYTIIDNHTLIHLEGKIKQPVFLSILQHGDEYTGWDALQSYLQKKHKDLPRSIIILFGNLDAAKHNVRQLDHQPDFNRCWPSHLELTNPTARIMQEITDIVREHQPFASVDIHNNSGRNPHYSGINSLKQPFINLASLFSDTMIYFTNPYGIQSGAFAEICPAITIECGLSGKSNGIEQTEYFLETLFNHENLNQPRLAKDQQVYKIFATVKIDHNIDFSYEQDNHEFMLTENLDFLNFKNINKGEVFGKLNQQLAHNTVMPFVVTDQNNNNITDEYFTVIDNKVICNKSCVPAMITQKVEAIKDDCLCYIMQPISIMPTY